jgi:hypothetical protein
VTLSQLLSTPCTIVRRSASGTTDEHGNDIPSETTAATVCELQLQPTRASGEPSSAGELSNTLWDLFLPTGTDIRTGDAVVVRGQEYELVGDPWDATTGSASMHHVEATVRRTVGAEDES